MTSFTDYLTINTKAAMRSATSRRVERVRAKAGLRDGFVLVSTMHITSSIFVNDHESGLYADIMKCRRARAIRARLPAPPHGEDNADAHLKRMI